MSKTFTRLQNEKFIAAQNDVIKSITNAIETKFEKSYAATMWTTDNKSYITFDMQNEDGSISRDTICFPSMLCDFSEKTK